MENLALLSGPCLDQVNSKSHSNSINNFILLDLTKPDFSFPPLLNNSTPTYSDRANHPPPITNSSQPTNTSKMSASAQAGARLEDVKQKVEAAVPKKLSGLDLYSRFAFAGAVCCSVTHGALTPVDVFVPPCTAPYFDGTRLTRDGAVVASRPASSSTRLPTTVA